MITNILYRCPECGGFEWLEQGCCRHCHASVQVLSRKRVAVNGKADSIAGWYAKVRGFALPEGKGGKLLTSGRIRLSREMRSGRFTGQADVHAIRYDREPVSEGRLGLYPDRLRFKGASSNTTILFARISAVTIESNTVIVDCKNGPALFFDFLEESGKKWEDCIQAALACFHHPKVVSEFCPRIRFSGDGMTALPKKAGRRLTHAGGAPGSRNEWPAASFLLKWLVKHLAEAVLDMRLSGRAHVPGRGAAILAANHVSLVDGIILAACLPRPVRFMTKNSQFNHALVRKILRLGGAFPVMRYRTDLLAVRNALRILDAGHVLGVFPEGERSWDGRMLPFKRGTLRLMLASGKPVVPVGIAGIYELMPRWTASPKRVPVRINIGRPLHFAPVPIADQTENDVNMAGKKLREAILTLSGGGGDVR